MKNGRIDSWARAAPSRPPRASSLVGFSYDVIISSSDMTISASIIIIIIIVIQRVEGHQGASIGTSLMGT